MNFEASNLLSQVKADIFEEYSSERIVAGNGDYGFINLGSMPSGSYTGYILSSASQTNWATTGEFSNIASNHCGATAVTNLALYYAQRGYSKLKINSSKTDTFKAAHKIIGNGPVMSIAGGAKSYFSNRGYTLNYSNVASTQGFKNAIKNNRPVGLLLAEGIVSWHWILGVGYRDYTSSGIYFRVVDGWNNSSSKFYKPHSGSAWWSATQYWVS